MPTSRCCFSSSIGDQRRFQILRLALQGNVFFDPLLLDLHPYLRRNLCETLSKLVEFFCPGPQINAIQFPVSQRHLLRSRLSVPSLCKIKVFQRRDTVDIVGAGTEYMIMQFVQVILIVGYRYCSSAIRIYECGLLSFATTTFWEIYSHSVRPFFPFSPSGLSTLFSLLTSSSIPLISLPILS